MSGVFLSYSRGDRAIAGQILQNLRDLGVEVWWDEDMPGVDWQEELAQQINELAAVLVVWTPLSSNSKNVRDEARLGQHTEKLVNVIVGIAAPPFPFDRVNGLPLNGWTGRETHGGWTRLIRTIEERLVVAGAIKPGLLTAALKRREETIAGKRRAIADAEIAYGDAKSAEAASDEALTGTRAEYAAADAQLRSVIDMKAGASLLKAAQQQLDAALAARTDAEQARRSAAATLVPASRSLASAKAEFERLFTEADRTGQANANSDASESASLASGVKVRVAERPTLSPAARDAEAPRGGPATRSLPWRSIVAACVAIALVAVIAVSLTNQHSMTVQQSSPAAALTPKLAASVPMSSSGPSAEASSQTDGPMKAFIGHWDVGLGCGDAVTISDDNGVLTRTYAGATVSLTRVPSVAAAEFKAPDGSRYRLSSKSGLSLIPAGGSSMVMIPCAG